MAKTIIVSNRLPVRIERHHDRLVTEPSVGGLATGLQSIYRQGDNIWVGWPGIEVRGERERRQVSAGLAVSNMRPIFLSEQELRDFYEGFSNETLWPCFHYFTEYALYDPQMFATYQRVNRKFRDEIVKIAKPNDTIWIHDYQLLLLPHLVREHLPNSSIGFFQHIPFPSFEVFRLLPWRVELLNGMLGADLIGFHTYDDMRHFLSSVSRLLGIGNVNGQMAIGDRAVVVDAFPMGIDYERYATAATAPATIEKEVSFRTSLGDKQFVLSIDRLDYTKGIPRRLQAFEQFLMRYPSYRGKVSLLMVVVPSRANVQKYQRLKEEIDLLVGRINGELGDISWTPIHYFYRSFPLESLSAFYRMANVALVTPMRDGMNLVCKEFVASRLERRGVLILSEMAGSSKELSDAILINPNDTDQLVEALNTALTMEPREQEARMANMQNTLQRYNIHKWVQLFMKRLQETNEMRVTMSTRRMDSEVTQQICTQYSRAATRFIFLDYDNTLKGFHLDPLAAVPDKALYGLLGRLSNPRANRIVIISGRDRRTLAQWFGEMALDLVAEHGVWIRERGTDWRVADSLMNDWKVQIRPILESCVDRTPGSFIEEKDYSLAWHYRKVETGLGELRAGELTSHLSYLAATMQLQVLEGSRVLEIKSAGIDKGHAARRLLRGNSPDFVLAAGDDRTDEDMFRAMPKHAVTIKVGTDSSAARYHVIDFREMRQLLENIVQKNSAPKNSAPKSNAPKSSVHKNSAQK